MKKIMRISREIPDYWGKLYYKIDVNGGLSLMITASTLSVLVQEKELGQYGITKPKDFKKWDQFLVS